MVEEAHWGASSGHFYAPLKYKKLICSGVWSIEGG
jgi:hypothetical protein